MLPPNVSYADLERLQSAGPPLVAAGVGRLFGLGPAERRALAGEGMSGIPSWSWALLGLGAGIVIGVRVYKKWPSQVPELIQGAKR